MVVHASVCVRERADLPWQIPTSRGGGSRQGAVARFFVAEAADALQCVPTHFIGARNRASGMLGKGVLLAGWRVQGGYRKRPIHDIGGCEYRGTAPDMN